MIELKQEHLIRSDIRLTHVHIYDNVNIGQHSKNFNTITFQLGGAKGGTYHADKPSIKGGAGLFCLTPREESVVWHVEGRQNFVNLCFSDLYVKKIALSVFDIDPRILSVPVLSFEKNKLVETLFRASIVRFQWDKSCESSIFLEQVAIDIIVALIKNSHLFLKRKSAIRGGLSPSTKTKVVDYIQHHYHNRITLKELADIAELSEYHFLRMFKTSLLVTPHQYIAEVRVDRVKELLLKKVRDETSEILSLNDIAKSCGYYEQSHMGKSFKKITGHTPKQYLNCIGCKYGEGNLTVNESLQTTY